MTHLSQPALAGLAIAAALLPATAFAAVADPNTFFLDPSESYLFVGGTVGGVQTTAQVPGSNRVTLEGDLVAEVLGNTLNFTAGSFDGVAFGTPLSPGLGGVTGSAEADFGLTGTLGIGPVTLGGADLAGRHFIINVLGSAPLNGETVDGSSLSVQVLSGVVDYAGGIIGSNPFFGSESLAGQSVLNNGSNGSITVNGDVQALYLPVQATYTFSRDGIDGQVLLQGQIYATRLIPEPAAATTLLSVAGLLLGRRRR